MSRSRRTMIIFSATAAVGMLGVVPPATADSAGAADGAAAVDDCPQPTVTCEFGVRYGPRGMQTLDVIVPSGMTGSPSVVVIHGGGWSGGTSENVREQAIYFAQNGIASFSINYTLSTPTRPSWPQAFEDVKLAAQWIEDNASTYGADGSRLAAFGSSAGGHLAALLDTAGPEDGRPVLTAVAWSGPMDLRVGFAQADPKQQGTVRRFLGCVPGSCPNDEDLAASPARHVTSDDGSVLFFNSDDEIVPVVSAQAMNRALAAAQVPHQLVVFPGTKHAAGFQCVPATVLGVRAPVIDGTVRWLGRVLTGSPVTPTGTFCR